MSRRIYLYLAVFSLAILLIMMQKTTSYVAPVIVVGGGLAGLTTSYELVYKYKRPVVLLEKTSKWGGNSIKASSGINGAGTQQQKYLGIRDSAQLFKSDCIASSKGLYEESKIDTLVENSKDAVAWLSREFKLSLNKVNQLGGHSVARTHLTENVPPGFEIVSALRKKLEQSSLLQSCTDCKVTELVVEHGKVVGIMYLSSDVVKRLEGPVVLSTGGFGANKQLIKEYRPDLANIASTNGVQTTGDGHLLARQAGGQLLNMDQIQVHPTGFLDPNDPDSQWKILAPEALRGNGGILVDSHGQRFVNELSTRDVVSAEIMKLKGQKCLLILSSKGYLQMKTHMDFYLSKGLMVKGRVSDLGAGAAATLEQVNSYWDKLQRDPYARSNFLEFGTDIYYGYVTPVVHFTMGGVRVDGNNVVLQPDGKPIYGLFALGELANGVHGRNRLGGNSLLECVVFGRRVAEHLATPSLR